MFDDREPDNQEFIELLRKPETITKHISSILYICDVRIGATSENKNQFPPIFVSPNIRDVFGYDPSEVLGDAHWWLNHLHPDDRSRILADLETLFARGSLSHTYRFQRSEGDYLWVQDDVALVLDQAGNPMQIVGAWRDISIRKKAMEELIKYYDRYRTLFENIVDIYYRTDLDGRLQLISPSCLTQTGYTPEEVIGRPVTDFYADPAQREALLGALHEKETVNDFEVKLVAKDGSIRYASVTSHLIRDRENGQPVFAGCPPSTIRREKQKEGQCRLCCRGQKSPKFAGMHSDVSLSLFTSSRPSSSGSRRSFPDGDCRPASEHSAAGSRERSRRDRASSKFPDRAML